MVKKNTVTYVSGRKGTTKVFTTRQEADHILDTLHGIRPKKYIRPQTTLTEAKVIKKINKWTIESYLNWKTDKINYAITDGMCVYYPIIYDNGVVAYDDPYPIPKGVKNWFENFASRQWLSAHRRKCSHVRI